MLLTTQIEKFLTKRRGAIHVGAHTGKESHWYAHHRFTPVVYFEPNPEVFDELQNNISRFEGHSAFMLGVHDTLKKATLHIASNDGQSSSLLKFGTHRIHRPDIEFVKDIKIDLVRLDEAIENIENFNFLNIDVQGVELNVIRSLGDKIKTLDYVYTEVNEEEVYQKCSLIKDIDNYLSQFGFVRVITKMTPAHWGDAFYKRYGG